MEKTKIKDKIKSLLKNKNSKAFLGIIGLGVVGTTMASSTVILMSKDKKIIVKIDNKVLQDKIDKLKETIKVNNEKNKSKLDNQKVYFNWTIEKEKKISKELRVIIVEKIKVIVEKDKMIKKLAWSIINLKKQFVKELAGKNNQIKLLWINETKLRNRIMKLETEIKQKKKELDSMFRNFYDLSIKKVSVKDRKQIVKMIDDLYDLVYKNNKKTTNIIATLHS